MAPVRPAWEELPVAPSPHRDGRAEFPRQGSRAEPPIGSGLPAATPPPRSFPPPAPVAPLCATALPTRLHPGYSRHTLSALTLLQLHGTPNTLQPSRALVSTHVTHLIALCRHSILSVTVPSSPPYRPESRLLHDAFVCARVALPSYATPPALRYAAAPPMPPRPSHPSTPIHLHRSPYAALLPARCCIAVVLSSPPALRYAIRTALHRLPNATARPMLHSCLSDAVSLSSA
ncbi:hypothetical protein B0H14DRAFT_3873438 [Mycena olivaceomarginata]|nr:hypothetical protein B0H14DRAFT_3873438 [Mycena olivaceomarginata]